MPAISASSGDCASWGVLAIDLELLVNRSGQVFLAAESHANAEFEGFVAAEDARWSDHGTTTTAVSQFRFPSLPTTIDDPLLLVVGGTGWPDRGEGRENRKSDARAHEAAIHGSRWELSATMRNYRPSGTEEPTDVVVVPESNIVSSELTTQGSRGLNRVVEPPGQYRQSLRPRSSRT